MSEMMTMKCVGKPAQFKTEPGRPSLRADYISLEASLKQAEEKYEHVCFAIGQCYEDSRFNVRQALRLADERMYEDKRKFYAAHPELKR